MTPDIRWLGPLYGYSDGQTHIAVPEEARAKLLAMVKEVLGTNDLVGIYIPEGTDDVYQAGARRGRIVGAVRLVPMPDGKRVEDYHFKDWDGSLRWPVGWPCEAVYAPPVESCPVLREHVESVYGPGSFGGFVARFQNGPFALYEFPTIHQRVNDDFAALPPLDAGP